MGIMEALYPQQSQQRHPHSVPLAFFYCMAECLSCALPTSVSYEAGVTRSTPPPPLRCTSAPSTTTSTAASATRSRRAPVCGGGGGVGEGVSCPATSSKFQVCVWRGEEGLAC